jgi:hypothetical protein
MDQLESNVSNLLNRIPDVVVVLEEVKDRRTQDLEGETHVTMVVEPVEHRDTKKPRNWVCFRHSFQDIDLESSSFPVLIDIFDDFECDFSSLLQVCGSNYFSKGSFSEALVDSISRLKDISSPVD